MEEVDRKQPAIVGGVIVGVLSVIPLVNIGNACCCLYALIGGAVAAKLLIDRSPQPVKAGDGAMIGLMAGAIGGVIYVVIGLPLGLLANNLTIGILESLSNSVNDPNFQSTMGRVIEQLRNQSLAERLVAGFISAIIFAILQAGFTVLGGLLGVALFEKRKGDSTPPPPPQYPPQYPPPYPPSYPSTTPPPPPPSPPPPSGEGGEPGSGSA